MNKIIKLGLVAAGMCLCGGVNAQQITNGDFESGWENCYPWEKGSKGSTAYGTQPTGWCVSNVPNSLAGTVGNNVTGYNSNSAVQIINTSAVGNGIPGYMTLGTTWATAETKMTSTRNKDGGVFGGVSFTHRPDALQLVYKRDNSKSSTDVSTVVVYTWKGLTSQADVPSNTAVGVISWGSATKVTMTNRDNNILGVSTNTGGTVTYSSDFKLLSSTTKTITGSASSWTTLDIPLEYEDATIAPEMMNIVISAAGYQDGGASITDGVSLTVDDVKFVYYHALSALSYDGATINFDENTTSYDLSNVCFYDASKLHYTVKGIAATAATSYDESTAKLSIKVTGDDGNSTTYTIQFANASATMSISDAKYATFCAPFAVSVPSGVTASTASLKTGDAYTLNLTSVGSTINACTPVILYSESPVNTTFYGINKATSATCSTGILTGVYTSTDVTSGYVLQKNSTTGYVGFYEVKETKTVPANRAYIAKTSGVKVIYFDEATAIKAINALTSGEPTEIYSVSGARQDKLRQGLNIVKMADGSTQKILVK